MQTILGANGPIGVELAKELKRNFTSDIRIVSRKPVKVNDIDTTLPADLSVKENAMQAVKGSAIAYFTLRLPMNTALWEQQFLLITRNIIDACKLHGTRLVFFDNTYMYPQDGRILKEDTVFAPVGRKGRVRQAMAEMVLQEMQSGQLEVVICRAPEFYGPGKTQSITNSMIFDNIKKGKKLKLPLSANKKRSLIWTPDASRATAWIGNAADTFGQTWHLPVDESHPTYKELIVLAAEVYERKLQYTVIPKFVFKIGSIFNKQLRELQELLPRYEHDNIFDDSKFRKRFSDFGVTSYREGIEHIREEQRR
ncbi:NAD-dependent epimerase/dehydratase family protein [Niabella sp. 22666]|uniref:NAD-dependent epimerase/dehydratase family protein n=1 Tax=Niabella sp. 22666 TaxID=3453954 RepID=UPI003F83C4A1